MSNLVTTLPDTTNEWTSLVGHLRAARERAQYSQRRLGVRLEMAEAVVGRWENSTELPSLTTLIQWSHALGLAPILVDPRGRPVHVRVRPRQQEPVEDYASRLLVAAFKSRRRSQHLTQQQVGDKSGVSEWTVRMWETGRRAPRIGHLLAWSGALACRIHLERTSAAQ